MSDLEIRAPREEDVAAIVDLFNAVSVAGYGEPDTGAAEIRSWFGAPEVDVERDVRVAFRPDGTLVGYGDVADDGGLHTRLWLDVRIRPGSPQEVADALLDVLEPRARELAADAPPDEVPRLRGFGWTTETDIEAVYRRRGYDIVRRSYRMRIDLAEEPPAPEWPEGITVRTFEPERDARAVYHAQNEGFADMWEYVVSPYEEWEHHMIGYEGFDPTLFFLALDGDEIAGICLARTQEADSGLGWVRVLAVRPPWRRRGIGESLLRHAFHEFRARGHRHAGLGVDGESTTGALELYTRAGMQVAREGNTYDRELDPSG
jgi:mycothiol synthase